MLVSLLRPLIWVFLWGHLRRLPDLLKSGYGPEWARQEQRRAGVGCALYAVSAVVAAFVPVLAIVLAMALSTFYALTAHGSGPRTVEK